ncbi:hypothetical protein PCASD_13785 [Puccinia coronata f. sp. avenae]|uniref:Uncharacterized protein n=1 Tax=Puccinia coronata f. sp. avenae TaxID=200324 RepID=A0A2N5UE40_9BASI|nr:hypothetical protein PCASD_24834 [Puccinia coronata f. sp. avenae]PLW35991.1 hypothetical protein PCASD_13785 [Puccinia coronata f. sp. avenae]
MVLLAEARRAAFGTARIRRLKSYYFREHLKGQTVDKFPSPKTELPRGPGLVA